MRVAVLGAGYAGLTVARRLERALPDAVDIVVVDDSNEHLVQHELHRVIRHPALVDAITVPLENVLSRAEIVEATVTDIDTEDGVVTFDDGDELTYDYGAVCLGSETAFYGLDDVEAAATPLKTLDDAQSIREDALAAAGGDAVVGGGGLSGIQTAGELAALSREEDLDLDVTLVEMAERIAPGFDATFAEAIRRELDDRGVTVETDVAVESADDGSVVLEDGRTLPADVFVWTGGIRGPDSLGGERQVTPEDLRVSERTFVVGDTAAVAAADGDAVPASAQTAVRQAGVAASNIARLIDGYASSKPVTIPVQSASDVSPDGETDGDGADAVGGDGTDDGGDHSVEGEDEAGELVGPDLETYDHETVGWVVSVGDGAVAKVGPVVFSGEPAKAAKAVIGFGHLGSVGAIRQASELVAEELGWPTAHGLGFIDRYEGTPSSRLPTDPGSPGELGEPVAILSGIFGEALGEETAIDLTALTRQFDSSSPGNLLGSVQRVLLSPFQTDDESEDDDGSEQETVVIDLDENEFEDVDDGDDAEGDGETGGEDGDETDAEDGDDAETGGEAEHDDGDDSPD